MAKDDDYWEEDELEDRIYHARQYEKYNKHKLIPRGQWFIRRSKSLLPYFGLILLIWWFLFSGEKATKVDWSRYAYSLYTTDTQSLCNALMVFESLHRLGSKADRVLLYPQNWHANWDDYDRRLMLTAERQYGVKPIPVELLSADTKAEQPGTLRKPSNWNLSLTKIRVFELVQYDRVLSLDSDIKLLQHMDELFLMPKTPMAMPRAYWSDGEPSSWPLTSFFMLLEPNTNEVHALTETLRQWQSQPGYNASKKYDMELLNHRFGASAMVLPHRPYAMLTAEFRNHDHSTYLGYRNGRKSDVRGAWDPDEALKEAKLVHFSDWPLPKPWIMWPTAGLMEMQPDCDGLKTCRERVIWKGLYEDFRLRRKKVCKLLSVPAPDWASWKNSTGAG